MPYYYRRWRKRRYYRRPWRWRIRSSFRRKPRRRYWVRRKKLSKIAIKEWQPQTINKLTVKGLYPLFMCNEKRISNNLIQWIESVAPPKFPAGGGFSIMQFSLQALYEDFVKARNWWTKSNCTLPLVRYNGCVLKFYRTEHVDYLVNIERCYPLKATQELYMSTQPGIMGLTKRTIHVPCRQHRYLKKPYKKVRVKPPTQMQTGWMFQKDLANFPLLIIKSVATSLDRYFTSSQSINTTISFQSLNTQVFENHDWQGTPTDGYHPQANLFLWGTKQGTNNPKLKQLIYLGGTGLYQEGTEVGDHQNYATTPGLWGNLFHVEYFTKTNHVFQTNMSLKEAVTYIQNNKEKNLTEWQNMTEFTRPFVVECRYNPFADKSNRNKVYVVSNLNDHTQWQPPHDKPQVLIEHLPLWLSVWGYLDFLRKGGIVSQVDINYITVLESPYIQSTPKLTWYVPIDHNFNEDPPTSPYQDTLNPSDRTHFYLKNTFQIQTINLIAQTGPGTVKLPGENSCEAHFEYMFKFKLGGCPAPMEKLCNPSEQQKYPIPNFKQQTPSLQSPETAIQTFLYNFDERRGMLTDSATKRIKKDYGPEKTSFTITGCPMDLPAPNQILQTEDQTTSEEEEEETTFQLLKLRYQQQQLRQRILNLISQNTE
nr:MAG: ORF1 [TTV-like mini virus]